MREPSCACWPLFAFSSWRACVGCADGKGQCIEFDYFNGKDTAVDLAREMVDDLNLSPEDAQAIVQAIAFKVARMTGTLLADRWFGIVETDQFAFAFFIVSTRIEFSLSDSRHFYRHPLERDETRRPTSFTPDDIPCRCFAVRA